VSIHSVTDSDLRALVRYSSSDRLRAEAQREIESRSKVKAKQEATVEAQAEAFPVGRWSQ
jgi:hypothetical protein